MRPFHEYSHVHIKGKNVTGDIIDVFTGQNGITYYTVESDAEGPIEDPDAWNAPRFPQFFCTADQLEFA